MLKTAAALCGLLLVALVLCSCRGEKSANTTPPATVNSAGNSKAKIKISSTVFQDGAMIPRPYTCDGPNVSPSLKWENVPDGAKTLALIADDPDAPNKTWVHWVLYNLPADVKGLVENAPKQSALAGGAGLQGKNDFGQIGYDGPCPPNGTHRYYFKLYALDAELALEPGATKEELLKAMEGHILAEGQLIGKYQK